MDVYFNCAQPTYEDLEMTGDWVLDNAENLLREEEEDNHNTRPAPGTPAPRSVMVPLFPGRHRRRRSAREIASGRCPMPSTKKYLSPDVWRFSVLMFCDVSTLLRLHRTSSQLRHMIDDPMFVTEWQEQAWFIKRRGCHCERNTFYLDASQFLDFAWDCLDLTSSRTSEVALRSTGRCVNYELAHRVPLPFIDPRTSPRCFLPGLMDMWYENWIIPMPRMTFVRVEDQHVRVPPGERSEFWQDHHPVPELDREESETPEQVAEATRREKESGRPLPAHFVTMGPDMVHAYEQDCLAVGRDPLDPMVDNGDCLGYHAVRWARRRMYESAVGIQTYPMHLCLRRSDLTGRAYRSGTQYLDLLFLPVHRPLGRDVHPEGIQMLTHNGALYFHPVRYHNERGDFVPWALSTIALMNGVYRHAWFDSCQHILQRMDQFARDLAHEVQTDMPMYAMIRRWNHLHRRVFLGEAAIPNWHVGGSLPDHPIVPQESTTPVDGNDRRSRQDQAALHLMYDPHYTTFNRVIGRMAQQEDRFGDESPIGVYPSFFPYLTELLGDEGRPFAGQRTASELIQELRDLMYVTDYIVRFALTIAPLTDHLTEVRRFRCLSVYLGAATSLMMFAPCYTRMPHWRPSAYHQTVANEIPRIDLHANHRYQRYLRFLNRRTLYHVPDPTYPADAYPSEINPRA